MLMKATVHSAFRLGALTASRGSDHENIFRRDFLPHILRQFVTSPSVAQCNGHGLLGVLLADDEPVQLLHQLRRLQIARRHARVQTRSAEFERLDCAGGAGGSGRRCARRQVAGRRCSAVSGVGSGSDAGSDGLGASALARRHTRDQRCRGASVGRRRCGGSRDCAGRSVHRSVHGSGCVSRAAGGGGCSDDGDGWQSGDGRVVHRCCTAVSALSIAHSRQYCYGLHSCMCSTCAVSLHGQLHGDGGGWGSGAEGEDRTIERLQRSWASAVECDGVGQPVQSTVNERNSCNTHT